MKQKRKTELAEAGFVFSVCTIRYIMSCCNLGVSKDGAVSQLVLNYEMDEKEARLAAEEYWS